MVLRNREKTNQRIAIEGEINKSCGLDIHKRFFIATILSSSGEIQQQRFDRDDNGILNLKNWVTSEECDVVACESTSQVMRCTKMKRDMKKEKFKRGRPMRRRYFRLMSAYNN